MTLQEVFAEDAAWFVLHSPRRRVRPLSVPEAELLVGAGELSTLRQGMGWSVVVVQVGEGLRHRRYVPPPAVGL